VAFAISIEHYNPIRIRRATRIRRQWRQNISRRPAHRLTRHFPGATQPDVAAIISGSAAIGDFAP
jgi:hypothetical protein